MLIRGKGWRPFLARKGERCMKDTVHAAVHRSVHLFGEGKFYGALRLRFTRPLILDKGKTPEWAGATPLRCHGNRGGRSRPHVCCYARRGRRGIGMLLTIQKSYELLAKYQFFAREICDTCGIVLGAIRFTRRDESGVWCSRECRGDGDRRTIRKGGRPRKYKTENERRQAERRQNA